jgi:hypothetical protein
MSVDMVSPPECERRSYRGAPLPTPRHGCGRPITQRLIDTGERRNG